MRSVAPALEPVQTRGAGDSLTAVEREGRFLIDERSVADLPGVRVFAAEAAPAVGAALTASTFGLPDAFDVDVR